jgi:hypothetical protein
MIRRKAILAAAVALAMKRTTVAVAALGIVAVAPAFAQAPGDGRPPTVASCEDKRTLVAVAQGFGVNLVINRANAWLVEDGDFAKVDFQSWMQNLKYGWQWDETQFTVNMFAHPYHGALYFDAARANCLSFWEAIPLTFLGSWVWEFLGERWRPSLNDFWMTGFGGAALGEMLHRVSAGIIDERATGGERLARELGALVVNPMGGLNRLARGDWWRTGPNAVDRLPEAYLFRASVGGRRVEETGSAEGRTYSPTLLLDVVLGDPFDTPYSAPFDVTTLLAQVSPDGGGLNLLRATGRLYGRELTDPGSWHRHQVNFQQRFDYVRNPAYSFGQQSIELGLHSRWRTGLGDLRVGTRLAGEVVMLGAIDALDAGAGGRTIDFGPGLGATAEISVERNGYRYLSFYNRVRYLRSVSGAPADHAILFSGFDFTIPVTRQIGIGAYVSGDRRRSYYSDFPDDVRTYRETRIYVTWTMDQRATGRPR